MTLEEIIKKENEIIKHEQFFQDTHIVFTDDDGEDVTIEMLHCDDTECIEESLEISKYNLEYHQQLVDCIKELEVFRKERESYNQALEKQIPKEVSKMEYRHDFDWTCNNCDTTFKYIRYTADKPMYCSNCGQALKWE